MKIVINRCYGGFSLSRKGVIKYLELKGEKAYFYEQTKFKLRDGINLYEKIDPFQTDSNIFIHIFTSNKGNSFKELNYDDYFSEYDICRTDPNLIRTVEELGDEAGGRFSRLMVVEIPDDIEWEIWDEDGLETIHEKHRSWPDE